MAWFGCPIGIDAVWACCRLLKVEFMSMAWFVIGFPVSVSFLRMCGAYFSRVCQALNPDPLQWTLLQLHRVRVYGVCYDLLTMMA